MENEQNHTDDFASFLQDATSDFKMYPSRRVWHSLYNNLHPSSRWPSVAVLLLLTTCIMYLGVSNNNDINNTMRANGNTGEKNILVANIIEPAIKSNTNKTIKYNATTSVKIPLFTATSNGTNQVEEIKFIGSDITTARGTDPLMVLTNATAVTVEIVAEKEESFSSIVIATPGTKSKDQQSTTRQPQQEVVPDNNQNKIHLAGSAKKSKKADVAISPDKSVSGTEDLASNTPGSNKSAANELKKSAKVSVAENALRSWIDSDVFYNKPADKSLKARAAMQYYVTVAEGFRRLSEKTGIASPAVSSSLLAPGVNTQPFAANINDRITQNSSTGIEAGAMFLYRLNKKWRAKAGLQFNYTNYLSGATDLEHNVNTGMVVLKNTGRTIEQRNSVFLNAINSNNRTLNNSTTQISIPIGADYKIKGWNRLAWFVGATVQPSLVIGGNVYAISADNQYYIKESSLLRKTNINTSVETFLSYRTSNGITLTAGPQARYQLKNTYKSTYNYNEKLYNYGVKIGLVKDF